uniref:Uncharacterized protein n=1 Tax=Octopus bimaculoides TaxID=37653 RepID=A0A0L8G6F4_OCTBM
MSPVSSKVMYGGEREIGSCTKKELQHAQILGRKDWVVLSSRRDRISDKRYRCNELILEKQRTWQ